MMTRTATIVAIALLAATAACSPRVATHGNMVDDTRLGQIQPGVSTRNDVASTFGSPTTISTFDPNVWYYIGQRVETVAFFAPEVVQRRVLRIQFDDTGAVADLRELSLDDAEEVELVERETPTLGRQMGILEQFIGNLGRFTGDEGNSEPAGR